MDIVAWLRGLGLERYAPAFRDNDIDAEVLPQLTADDLISIGVTSVGHRRKLLAAIAGLGVEMPAATVMAAPRDAPAPADAERRQLTVMFCDLVGSTELSARLDPEDLREVIAAYQRAVADVVRSFDGFIAKYMGDGVLVYFGYPRAHEDDAERAVRAGLGCIDAVSRLDVKSVKPQARVGIATGVVVVGDLIGEGSAQEQSVVGETPNLAARLQAVAEPETVVIAAGTRRLVGDLFEYRDLGAVEVKGIAGPVPAWQVLRPSAVESRFEALRGSSLSPLVGRDGEIDLLWRRWAPVKAGDGQIVLISGEPGIGKSRIAAALAERLHAEAHLRLRYFCSPYYQDSALFPFIDQIGRTAGFARDDPPAAKREKLEALLARADPPDADVALLADLMSLPASERHPLPNLSPQRKKEGTLEALLRHLEGLARRQPILIVFEDLHWADPSSRELLDLIVKQIARLPVLLVATFRPEFQPPWIGQPHVTALSLRRLARDESEELVSGLVGNSAALPTELLDEIIERTDGVPLFLEELTKALLESGNAGAQIRAIPLASLTAPATLTVPATLHASLMARLDRLGSAAKEIAQIGAAIGREFSYDLLAAVARRTEAGLREALGRLVDAGLVFQRGVLPQSTFLFKHALVQEAAHSTLLRGSRRQLHAYIAEALETHFPELMESQPEVLARHYEEAGLVEKSIVSWGRAGQGSVARSAMAEAAAQFQKALNQLRLLPDTPERQRRELELLSSLGAVMRAAKGQGAPETGKTYSRARELWDKIGSPSEFLKIPFAQCRYHMFRGELKVAEDLAQDLLRLSQERHNSAGLILGHYSSGRILMLAGKFASSRMHLEEVLTLYDTISHRALLHQAGDDPQLGSLAYLGIALFCLGYPDQALGQSDASITEARRRADPQCLAGSLAIGTRLLSLLGDGALLAEKARQLVVMAAEQGFPYWRELGNAFCGWAKVKNGDVMEGLSLLRSGSTACRATGSEALMPHLISLTAEASETAGQKDEALNLLKDAFHIVERTGERWFAAELNRHKGQLLLRQGHAAAAEELYRKALGIAEEQEAKLWELRAAMSLAQLWRDQGRPAEARDLLASIYGWFTEGFDTPDLREAKALLDELA